MHALRYYIEFDNIAEEEYSFEIHKKNYVGASNELTAGGDPVTHNYQTDEPKASIKGSSVTLTLINDGTLPISTFYSVSDDEYKGILYYGTQKLFEGFLVQDDCSEELRDDTHEIVLSFSDGLGLLKDVKINENIETIHGFYGVSGGGNSFFFTGSMPDVRVGSTIEFTDTNSNTFWGTYTINEVGSLYLGVNETIPLSFPSANLWVVSYGGFEGRISLMSVVSSALRATGLELSTNIFTNIKEVNHDGLATFLEDTFIDANTYIKGKEIESCYDVLDSIFTRFKCSLFQALGEWNIVRWSEYRYFKSTTWAGFKYDSVFVSAGVVVYDNSYVIDEVESYPLRSIFRPYKLVNETFNYENVQLLYNNDFKELGQLITSYTEGTGADIRRISEYQMPGWNANSAGGANVYYIRVVLDEFFYEIERYAVVEKGANQIDDDTAIYSTPFEVNQGDVIDISYRFKLTANPSSPNRGYMPWVCLTSDGTFSGANAYYLMPNGSWSTIPFSGTTGTPTVYDYTTLNQWQNASAKSRRAPVDGVLYVFMSDLADSWFVGGTDPATHYGDFSLKVLYSINESTRITGHIHETTQSEVIKNKSEYDIIIDDSPRNTIKGTLFLSTSTGLIQDKTSLWHYSGAGIKLGDLITFEELFYRKEQRAKLEGNVLGLVQGGNHLSMLSVVTHPDFTDENFIWGSMEINIKNDSASGVLWELFKDGEADADLTRGYEFKYLYDTK